MSGLIIPGQPDRSVPEMPPAARATATPCDEWILQLVAHLGRGTTTLGENMQAAMRSLAQVIPAVEQYGNVLREVVARLDHLEQRLAWIEELIDMEGADEPDVVDTPDLSTYEAPRGGAR